MVLVIGFFPGFAAEKPNEVSLDYIHECFDKTYDPWQTLTLELKKRTRFGALIGRLNQASRFNLSGQQFEIEAYPEITETLYAYLNAGFSSSAALFPQSRYGGEVYLDWPQALESSLGFRLLNFNSSQVVIYTAYLGKYYGDYWFAYRHYQAPQNIGISNSGQISIRRYFAEDYLTFKIGLGVSPDEDVSTLAIYQLNSQRAGLDFQKRIKADLVLKGALELEQEEINAGDLRHKFTLGLGIKKLF
jgi:YaiO family outer membrane protein